MILSACSEGSNSSGDGTDSSDGQPESKNADVLHRDDVPVEDDGSGTSDSAEDEEALADTEPGAATIAEVPDGYLVWAHYVQPAGLANVAPVEGGLYTASWIREALFESLYSVDASLEYVPELLANDAKVRANDNGLVEIEYRLRPDLAWSDGEPLTAADVEYTHEILVEGCLTEADGSILDASDEGCVYPLADRSGYDLVTGFEVTGDLTFELSMAAFYADWRGLYRQIMAAHAFGDEASEAAALLDGLADGDSAVPSSGPLVLESWDGSTLLLARNDSYHGSGHVDGGNEGASSVAGVQVSFVPSIAAAREAVATGAADVMVATVGDDTLDLLEGGDVAAVVASALEYDHLGMNRLNRHLADPLVRSAIVAAVGRSDAVAAGYQRLLQSPGIRAGESTISADGVGNAYWLPTQAGYQDHQPAALEPDPLAAVSLLTEAGYQREGSGTFSHPDRGDLRLRFSTNAGDEVRVKVQDVLVDQMEEAGFSIVVDNGGGGRFLTDGPFAELAIAASLSGGSRGDPDLWDLTLFAWAGGPWPGAQSGSFRSDSEANPYGFENPKFDSEAAECDTVVDDDDRQACYQTLDLFATTTDLSDDGLFVVPLVERPAILLYSPSTLETVPVFTDGDNGGPLSNVGDYRLAAGSVNTNDGSESEGEVTGDVDVD